MTETRQFWPTFTQGWRAYQKLLIEALQPLDESQLALRVEPSLRSVDEIARHIIGARARWFYMLIEHDLHHGGEISLTLGRHGLAAPAL